MQVTKSCIIIPGDMLTSSFYIHLKAENLLYRKNQRSRKLDHWMRRLLDRPQFSLSNEYNFIRVACIYR
ncbi:uncharacterized protein OCT59_016754 [Rhizophagus irregularis]|uniref:uncharacterized protein n=1 Tax=Rhizophagus irregularis TaxID=588596 RepID=UPI003331C9F3|nr:hypothetical protein OCT59_016754 [Rhizophagus irregularis]